MTISVMLLWTQNCGESLSCVLYFLCVGYRTEIKQGAEILAEKIKKYRPKIAAFNGKGKQVFFSVKYYNACLFYGFENFNLRDNFNIEFAFQFL